MANVGIFQSKQILFITRPRPMRLKLIRNRLHSTSGISISNYCLENVRKYEYENFLATLLLPKEARDSAFAIRAFNIAVAQIKDVTREELLASMRLQFWKDTLDKIYKNEPVNEPIGKALQKAKTKHNLSKKWLKNMIESRQDNLVDKLYPNIEAVETYSEKSNSSIYYLTLQCIGLCNVNADHVASHIGKSEGIIKLIRGIPHHAQKRIVTIPINLLALHKVSQEDIIRGKRSQNVKDLVYDLASVAFQHLEHATELEKEVPVEAKIAFLPALCLSSFLKNLQQRDFDIFDPTLHKRNSLLPLKLWWGKVRGTYSDKKLVKLNY